VLASAGRRVAWSSKRRRGPAATVDVVPVPTVRAPYADRGMIQCRCVVVGELKLSLCAQHTTAHRSRSSCALKKSAIESSLLPHGGRLACSAVSGRSGQWRTTTVPTGCRRWLPPPATDKSRSPTRTHHRHVTAAVSLISGIRPSRLATTPTFRINIYITPSGSRGIAISPATLLLTFHASTIPSGAVLLAGERKRG
jgi:hypothetical protein